MYCFYQIDRVFLLDMDVKLLKTFLAVADTASFHRAAERLNVTQAAISARVRTLEAALQVELFQRGPGGTRLSPAGENLRPHAEQMLAQWAHVSASIGRQHGQRIALRLGCQLSIWDERLLDLALWAQEHLGLLPLALNFDHDTNALDLVRRGLVDLTLTHERPVGGRLAVAPLAAEGMVLVARRACGLNDADLPLFLNLQLGPGYDAQVAGALGERQGHFFLGNAAMGLRYLQRRDAMGYFPLRMVAPLIDAGAVHEVAGARRFGLDIWAVHDPSAPAAALVAQLLPGLGAGD